MFELMQEKCKDCYFSYFSPFYAVVLVCMLLLSHPTLAAAAQVTLAWDANTEADLAGYNVYSRVGAFPSKEAYDRKITLTLSDLPSPSSPEYEFANVSDSETTFFGVTAYDDSGNESGLSNVVSYTAAPSPVPNQAPAAWFTANPTSGDAPLTVSFDASSSSDTDGNIVSYSWTFGDGARGTGVSPSHTYASAGIYTVSLTVTDDRGATDTTTAFMTCNDPLNDSPDPPIAFLPVDGGTSLPLTPELQTETFFDPDGNAHALTQWQISEAGDFASLVLDITTDAHLTSLTVPDSVLDGLTTYFWRVRFYDDRGSESEWSEAYSFTTEVISDDVNPVNGVPDAQEVDGTVDVDGNGVLDVDQMASDITFKSMTTLAGDKHIGIKGITNVASIESIKSIDPDTIADVVNRPGSLPFGLIVFKLVTVSSPGDVVEVEVYFSESVPAGSLWYKYDSVSGWQDYSARATFRGDGKSVVLQIMDGGFGDSDGVANTIIVDPGAVAGASTSGTEPGLTSSDSESTGVSGCFIATAVFGSYVEPRVKLLREFRDRYLLTSALGRGFVGLYYKYGPYAANFITEHTWLKPFVRMLLMPLVGLSYFLVKTSLVTKLLAALVALGLTLTFLHSRRRLTVI